MIRISKWSAQGRSARYYLNGFKGITASEKAWVEIGKGGLKVISPSGYSLANVLNALLEAGLITQDEYQKPSIEIFEVLSNTKQKINTTQSAMPSSTVAPIELNNEVTIVIDHREPKEIIDAFNAIKGVKVEIQALPVGDFIFPGGMVERKSANDLSQSIMDKRLFFQSDEMSSSDNQLLRAVIIEGDPYNTGRISINAIDGAISYLAVLQGLSVLNSKSPQHTANLVSRMSSHAVHGLGYEISYRQAKPKTIDDQILFVAQGLPGIGVESSKALLKHFGTLSAVFKATAKEIQEIDGFGKKTSEKIIELLNEVWNSS